MWCRKTFYLYFKKGEKVSKPYVQTQYIPVPYQLVHFYNRNCIFVQRAYQETQSPLVTITVLTFDLYQQNSRKIKVLHFFYYNRKLYLRWYFSTRITTFKLYKSTSSFLFLQPPYTCTRRQFKTTANNSSANNKNKNYFLQHFEMVNISMTDIEHSITDNCRSKYLNH